MATVASLISVLEALDPDLPVGALRVERYGEMHSFHLEDVVEVHTTHEPVSGVPVAAWVVTALPMKDTTPEVLRRSVPAAWTVVRHRCGCVLSLPVLLERRISTLAVGCPHYEPGDHVRRVAERSAAARPPMESG
jgi:hypothetical protein